MPELENNIKIYVKESNLKVLKWLRFRGTVRPL